jgi:hypothetical protein
MWTSLSPISRLLVLLVLLLLLSRFFKGEEVGLSRSLCA